MIELTGWPEQKTHSLAELAGLADRDEKGLLLEISVGNLRIVREGGNIVVPLHEASRWLHHLPTSEDGSDDHVFYSAVGS